ncbi:hypothetical protein TheetDRAFT_3213 [Thermoanaerobacter ethanolicus JW 200]|nr:hypothetical protein TheetDRAFT_3213 [Thermoanaerobacter ethanolicus JW 200]
METMEEDKTKHDNLVKLGVEEQKPGNTPIQGKATGEYPIAQS